MSWEGCILFRFEGETTLLEIMKTAGAEDRDRAAAILFEADIRCVSERGERLCDCVWERFGRGDASFVVPRRGDGRGPAMGPLERAFVGKAAEIISAGTGTGIEAKASSLLSGGERIEIETIVEEAKLDVAIEAWVESLVPLRAV